MMNTTIQAIVDILNPLQQNCSDVTPITSYSIDTRTIMPGALFFALRGSNVDGSVYVREAFQRGAAAAIVAGEYRVACAGFSNILYVEDPLAALQTLARSVARGRRGQGVAITGSCGKTTVKELLHHVLKQRFRTTVNKGNFNNHIGLPLSILNADNSADVHVIEMGASAAGEIAFLCDIARPRRGIITNVYPAHLKGFGSLDRVYETKTELAGFLASVDGEIVVDGDDPLMKEYVRRHALTVITIGVGPGVDYRAEQIRDDGASWHCTVRGEALVCAKIAVLHIKNMLAVLAMAQTFGISIAEFRDALQTFNPPSGRFTVIQKEGYRVINDCYNANPGSFRNSLDLFGSFSVEGRKVLVCGDMLELGERSDHFHREIGKRAAETGIDLVICRGDGGGRIGDGFVAAGGTVVHRAADNGDAARILKEVLKTNDTVLFKGSRGMKLEEIINHLENFCICC